MNERLIQRGFWSINAVLGTLILLRAILGPDSPPLHMKSPMDTQSCLGLAFVLVLAARARWGREAACNLPALRPFCLGAVALILLAAAAFGHTIGFYFLSDDFVLVKAGNSLRSGIGTVFAAETGYGFYRPITRLALAVESTWAQWDPVAWHLSALILHLANSLLVYVLSLRFCSSRFAAFFASALFLIHGTRPETAVWIAGRFDLLATFFVLCGLIFFIRSLDLAGPSRFRALAFALLSMSLAILSKESAYIFPLLLVLFLFCERGSLSGQIGSVLPFFLVSAALFAQRLLLYGGIGGYRDPRVGSSGIVTADVMSALNALTLRIWGALFFPVNWSIEPGAFFAFFLAAYLITLVGLAAGRIPRSRLAFTLGFVLIAVIPPLHLLKIGSDLEKSRFLYLPSIGFCLMMALASERLRGRMPRIIPAVVLIFNLFALDHNLKAWRYASDKARSSAAAAVKCIEPTTKQLIAAGLPATLNGVYFWGNGFPEMVGMQLKGAGISVELRQEKNLPINSDGSRWLIWDRALHELRCLIPQR